MKKKYITKKGMIGLSLALVVGVFSTFSYADGSLDGVNLYGDPTNEYSRPWGEDIFRYEQNNLKRAVKERQIAEQQDKTWENGYNYRHGHCSNS